MLLYKKHKICFIHIPKTAGSSITKYLNTILGKGIFIDKRHQLLCRYIDKIPNDYKLLTVVRNPYDRLVSMHTFWKGSCYEGNVGNDDYVRAYNVPFKDWINNWLLTTIFFQAQPTKAYITVDNKVPSNLTVIKFEKLNEELNEFFILNKIKTTKTLPHIKKSKHKPWQEYYDDETKQVIYNWDKWCFDNYYKDKI